MTEPLRKLIVKNLKSKSWLMEALKPDGFPSANLSERDKRVFIEKVIRYVNRKEKHCLVGKLFF
jgi:hypothetical protein